MRGPNSSDSRGGAFRRRLPSVISTLRRRCSRGATRRRGAEKARLGPVMLPVFRVLRGVAPPFAGRRSTPFGYTRERRSERAAIARINDSLCRRNSAAGLAPENHFPGVRSGGAAGAHPRLRPRQTARHRRSRAIEATNSQPSVASNRCGRRRNDHCGQHGRNDVDVRPRRADCGRHRRQWRHRTGHWRAGLCERRRAHSESVGRNAEKNRAAVAELGDGAAAFEADLTQAHAARAMVDDALARWGRLDVLVNNAGTNIRKTPRRAQP